MTTQHEPAPGRPHDEGPNDWLIEEMQQRFRDDPDSVSESWREFFRGNGSGTSTDSEEKSTQWSKGDRAAEQPAPAAEKPQETERWPRPRVETEGSAAPSEEPARARRDPGKTEPNEPQKPAKPAERVPGGDVENGEAARLIGITATIAQRMDESLEIPTATSVRSMPSKLLEVNRLILNNQLKRLVRGGKVSFTHLIGYAVARAMTEVAGMNVSYSEIDGKPHRIAHDHVNLGLAIDVERSDGTRVLLVPNIKKADTLDFKNFWMEYEKIVAKARNNNLTLEDFAGTTATLTNPGTLGTVQSVPRLMPEQGLIVGVGAITYPPEYQASDPNYLARTGIGRVITITSTYDHRVIQGAQSGLLLQRIHELLLGEDEFYDDIFRSLGIPYTPARWAVDDNPPPGSSRWSEKQANVFWLINAYRVRGHLIADLDPLRQNPPRMYPELDPLHYGLTIWDLDREYATGGLGNAKVTTLGRILSVLRDAYCRTIGIEYMHMQETEQKVWIQQRVETPQESPTREERIRILRKLNQAEAFEKFLHTKYVGHKRFGLEGSESLIPLLDAVVGAAAGDAMEEVVIGMAHRGRLNVLANIIGKGYDKIFREFEGDLDPETTGGQGDVKYHLGAHGKYDTEDGPIAVEVVANPSHLEAVDPVLEGVVRAKQERRGPEGHRQVLPLLIHGDAAFAGQGVVVETFNLSQLRGYRTGGTVHVVINNQVGFTTSTLDARSSFYATDVAKTVQAPIFHVNGDDPEAVTRVARLAFAFRQAFNKDVVIDMICYRRRGHNEGDEPSYTQPIMYKLIEEHEAVRSLYMERLVSHGELSLEDGEQLLDEFRSLMEAAFQETKSSDSPRSSQQVDEQEPQEPVTAVDEEELRQILEFLTTPPEGFTIHPKLRKVLSDRADVFDDGRVDWATAEALAYGSLAQAGTPVRLAGEDSRRGTFSHRHAELTDFETAEEWIPLQLLTAGTTRVRIVDSLLSEFAAVGFEYGYSVEWPEALVMWEAQFGDFANGAQVVIDQFIAAGEAKWGQQSGLTLLLPHGYEGQGPEHSSARIERYLELCAGDNIRVVVPATSGQYFHLLRRQALLRPAKPLIVFTPKSLLRSRPAFSPTSTMWEGSYEPLVADEAPPEHTRRLVLCAGKVFHDLVKARDDENVDGVEIVRLSQLYPLPEEQLAAVADRTQEASFAWCQEEPENMGAYRFLWPRLRDIFGREPEYTGRPAAASTATGSARVHARQQAQLVRAALGIEPHE